MLPERAPEIGELVLVRSRRWLVEKTTPPSKLGQSALITLACADDDNQGQSLEVYWDYELDRQILESEGWENLAKDGFDPPKHFAAFMHTLRWNCITSTDKTLFQSPFRAGIQIEAYQMEPLRKALQLPRVNLFIADDTGLGKTIEAGLIARELLLRKKVKTIVVATPPSVLEQWKAELEERFGLIFEILDRDYLARIRRERGFGVNPWRTHSRFLVSQKLLIDETYAGPMRDWLGDFHPGSLLILDEAHHAAPSSGSKYAIESKFTRSIRDICQRFEHRLFLSATPHNGHSNSFSTLLELLDPYRFTRGVPVRGKKVLEDIMVRRLKEDIRGVQGGFPIRNVVREEIIDLPEDAPELVLSNLLEEYRVLRKKRFGKANKRAQASAGLMAIGLQQRLLSSIEAFALTLRKHRKTVEKHWVQGAHVSGIKKEKNAAADLIENPIDADDDRINWTPEELEAEEHAQLDLLAQETESEAPRDQEANEIWAQELQILDEMQEIADAARNKPEAKTRRLIDWIRKNLCPGMSEYDEKPSGTPAKWENKRVIIFTENREGTKRHLKQILEQVIDGTDQADARIEVIDGLIQGKRRKEIQRRFNAPPEKDPLRILLATEAAQEGLNFQAHCTDLFHFDLPWNPGRIEQRNGRIDRKLQPADEVNCHYFVLPQRAEDHVLDVLVRKTETIKKELGSLSKVIEYNIEKTLLSKGIAHDNLEQTALELEQSSLDEATIKTISEEFDDSLERQEDLKSQIANCGTLLQKSRDWIGFESTSFRNALSCGLEILGAEPLKEGSDDQGKPVWHFPALDRRAEADSTWAGTLDTLRAPRKDKQKLSDWRKEAPIRPVVFEDAGILTEDTVHLHLEQRVAQRLLARFRAQGFIHHDLSRSCLAQSADSIPRVVLLGRLSLYGQGAERLHEEIVPVAARWIDPTQRKGELSVFAKEAESKTLQLLEDSFKQSDGKAPSDVTQSNLLNSAQQDVAELLPQLDARAQEIAKSAISKLEARGENEEKELKETLERQMKRVAKELAKHEGKQYEQLTLADWDAEEKRQLDANIRHWRERLEQFEVDINEEPKRVRKFYDVKARRVEPIGLVYLWPETN